MVKIKNIDLDNTTFVIGYWLIQENVKHDLEHYLKYLSQTLDMLRNRKVYFFYNEEEMLRVALKNKKTDQFLSKKIAVTDLPTYPISADFLEATKNQDNDFLRKTYEEKTKGVKKPKKEKGLAHYEREYQKIGAIGYRKIFSVWVGKVFLIETLIKEIPFDTDAFAWIDASASRFNSFRTNWEFDKQIYGREHLFLYRNNMRYYGEILKYNASVMIGHREQWTKLFPLYKKQLELSKNSNYSHDEETILHEVSKKEGHLFRLIDDLEKINY